jgi:hypothetical protein
LLVISKLRWLVLVFTGGVHNRAPIAALFSIIKFLR